MKLECLLVMLVSSHPSVLDGSARWCSAKAPIEDGAPAFREHLNTAIDRSFGPAGPDVGRECPLGISIGLVVCGTTKENAPWQGS